MTWEMIVGLETHVELATQSKIFCSCATTFGAAPNTQCCPVCAGLPGALPVLNEKAVELAIRAGLALDCSVTPLCRFDRKNYFYPDLPKAYQISQLYLPICQNGAVTISTEEGERQIRIHELHLEEDAGKLIHDPLSNQTQVDYNRCGVPLIEIVTEPDFRTAVEVVAYLEQLKLTLQYLGVSDGKMQEGSLRCDVNLSVRPLGREALGVRTEMKNLSSFKAIARAIGHEAQRQIQALEEGKPIIQETRRWDESKDTSYSMRSKENAQDYRYFPDPDLPPLTLSAPYLSKIRAAQPELPQARRARYERDFSLTPADAGLITGQRALADFFEAVLDLGAAPHEACNWLLGPVLRQLSACKLEITALSPVCVARLISLMAEGQLNRATAYQVFDAVYDSGDVDGYIRAHNLTQISDLSLVAAAVETVFVQHPSGVADYHAGKEKALGFLVGQTMRALQGKADPQIVHRAVLEKLML